MGGIDSNGINSNTSMVTEEAVDDIMKSSFSQADLASTDYDLILCPPSHIAICAIYNAISRTDLLTYHGKVKLLGHYVVYLCGAGTTSVTLSKIEMLTNKKYLNDSVVVSDDESDDDIIMEEAND